MVMVTAKLSKQKLLLIAALLVAVVVVLCLCLHGSGNSSETPDTAQEPVAVDVKTNEGRVAFLASFGWEVAEEPVQTQEVRVPTEPNEVFQRYNELQISQGYDLTQYSGKTLRRYVYTVTNYPAADGGPYYACSSTKTRSPGATSALPRRTASCTRSQCPPDRCGRICRGGRLCPPVPTKVKLQSHTGTISVPHLLA